MKNNLTPDYLSSLVPETVGRVSSYSLQNSQDTLSVHAKTALYYNSFLPSVIREWNNLPLAARNSQSLSVFKSFLNKDREKCQAYLFKGSRKLQILHTRIRTKCSSLNHHLFQKNIVQSPLCQCGEVESSFHYFFRCRLYHRIRTDFFKTSAWFAIGIQT